MSNFIFADKKMQDIWQDFIAHFKSESTILSYQTDILEFINFIDKGMDQITSEDVASYYDFMQQKVSAKILQPSTLAKKIRELNSFFHIYLIIRVYTVLMKTIGITLSHI